MVLSVVAVAMLSVGALEAEVDGLYLMPGAVFSARFLPGQGQSGHALIGGELSVAYVNELIFYGAFCEVSRDMNSAETLLTVGPEFGWSALGLDGGLVMAFGEAPTQFGVAVRAFFSIGYLAPFVRFAVLGRPSQATIEVGILVKLPLRVYRRPGTNRASKYFDLSSG